MNLSGGVFQKADYYTTNELISLDEARALVPEADDLNWLFVGTSGVHGSYATCADARAELREEGEAWLTVLIVQPRMVRTFYGHFDVTEDDIDWLSAREAETLAVIAKRRSKPDESETR